MKKKLLPFTFLLLFSAGLVAQWTNNPQVNMVICDITGHQVCSKLALNNQTGTGFISWFSHTGNDQYDVYMNTLNKDGILLWGDEGLMISDNPTMTWVTFYGLIIDDDNCAVLTNQDIRTGSSNAYAYRISPDGDFLWGEQGLQLTDNTNLNLCLSAVQDPNGDYLIGWTEDSTVITPQDTTYYSDIRFQKVKKDMSFPWGDPKVLKNDSINYSKVMFNFVTKPDNGFYLVFMGFYKPNGGLGNGWSNLYVQNFDQNGEALWDHPVALEPDEYLGAAFFIYGDSYYQKNGGIIIVWQSADGLNAEVKMQHLDQYGTKQCGDWGVAVSNSPDHSRANFESAYDTANDLTYVFWEDKYYSWEQENYYSGIAAQKLSSDGTRQWSDTGLLITPYVFDTVHAVWGVSSHPDGGALALNTEDYYSITGTDTLTMSIISSCRLNPDGEFVWNKEHIIVCDAISPKSYYTLSDYTNGEWIATWSDGRKDPTVQLTVSGIYAQNIKEDGTLGPLFISNPGAINHNELNVYPNPFSSETTITFTLKTANNVSCKLYNNSGSLVKTISPELFRKGTNTIELNSVGLSSGVYHIVLQTGNSVITKKVIVY